MSRSGLEAFSTIWRAYGEGRLERSLDLVDPDCEIALPDGGTLRGHDGVRAALASAQRTWKTLRIVNDDVFEDHDGCVVGTCHLAASSADGTVHVDRPIAFVAQFEDGRLVRGRIFAAREEAVRAARELRAARSSGG